MKRREWPKGQPHTVDSWVHYLRYRQHQFEQAAERAIRDAARFKEAADATLREDKVVEVTGG